jgi:ABC-2 type transport system ATP-binding protein
VLLIHEGRLVYDGSLSGLVERFAPYRQVRLELARAVERSELERFGEVEMLDGLSAVLIVQRARLTETVARVLSELKPLDLAVGEPPVERVVGQLFLEEDLASKLGGAPAAGAHPANAGAPHESEPS